jgi:hypothetical protein
VSAVSGDQLQLSMQVVATLPTQMLSQVPPVAPQQNGSTAQI